MTANDLHPAVYASTAIAVGDLFEAVPSARMDVVLMEADASYEPQAATIAALKTRGLIDRNDRPHAETLRALLLLAGKS